MRTLAFAAAALAVMSAPALAAWDVAEMNKQIDETNVLVDDDCSGTIIDREHGMILTADHGLCGAAEGCPRVPLG